jgi:hypothetical protein
MASANGIVISIIKSDTAPEISLKVRTVFFLALDLRRRRLAPAGLLRLPVLAILDLLPPASTVGFVLALGATLYPEAAARGVLPLHSPTKLGMSLRLAFFPVIWTEGRKQIQFQRPFGLLFAEWLVFAGAARILLSVVFHRAGGAQFGRSMLFALLPVLAGGALIAAVAQHPPPGHSYSWLARNRRAFPMQL